MTTAVNPSEYFYNSPNFKAEHEVWFSKYYRENHDKEIRLYRGVRELLERLKKKGFKLAVATNAHRNSTSQALHHLDIGHFFDSIVCGDEVRYSKPYPHMLEKVLYETKLIGKMPYLLGMERETLRHQRGAKYRLYYGSSGVFRL